MDRREALQLLATGAIFSLAPSKMFATLREARALLASPALPRSLSPHQFASAMAIADAIIPRTETPGAADVGVGDFFDLILTEWYTEPERKRFLNGLADVDRRTRAMCGKDFVDCSPDQKSEMLAALGDEMLIEAEAALPAGRRYRGSQPKPDKNFYYMIRSLTLTGYFTSEPGATKQLGFEIIPERHAGCAAAESHKETAENR